MKKLILPAFLFASWMAFLQTDLPVKGKNFLPALGRFLSPFHGIWQNVTANPISFNIQGHTREGVKILFDERDVPHIYASNLADAMLAQGYLHAANRFFSMDLSSRSAAGRLSELFGTRTIEIDRKQRERGFEWSAIEKASHWESYPENKQIMDAYIDGIHLYTRSLSYKNWPLEYKVLSKPPVEWTAVHSALTLTNMAIALCLREDDLAYTHAQNQLSAEEFAFLFPDHNPLESPIVPRGTIWNFNPVYPGKGPSVISNGHLHPPLNDSRHEDLNGSNNWAVSGGKTKNGAPILANDPHLGLTLPNIWYEVEIHTPEMSVHGVSLPGLPLVVIGFNEDIAWGSTNSGQDVLDWYQITWQDSSRRQYLLGDQYTSSSLRPEVIQIRGQPSVIDTIRYTHWGPVSKSGPHKDMAMKWIGHQKATSNDVEYLQKINKARNLAEYRDAVAAFQYPAQNKVFASREGDIAISVAGVIPVRPSGLGERIADGSNPDLDWLGYIPIEHALHSINPERGYVSSANQAPAAPDYPYPQLGRRVFEDFRGRVVNQVLDSLNDITPRDMMALQDNSFNLHAAEVLPLMLDMIQQQNCLKEEDRPVFNRIRQWNFEYHRDSVAPVFFDLWYKNFEALVWDELDTLGIMYPEEWRLTEIVRDHADHSFFDIQDTRDAKETAADIACLSFSKMITQYHALPSLQQSSWGAYKQSVIPHLARFPLFGSDVLHTSGGRHIVNAMSKSHGPSWRMIVELSTPVKAWVNYPGGQSGHPASPHYRDMLEHYFEGAYYEVILRKDPASWSPLRQIHLTP